MLKLIEMGMALEVIWFNHLNIGQEAEEQNSL